MWTLIPTEHPPLTSSSEKTLPSSKAPQQSSQVKTISDVAKKMWTSHPHESFDSLTFSQMKKCHHWIKLAFHSSQSVVNTFSVENVVTREGSESSIHRRWKRKVMQRFRGCAEILVFGRNIHLWGYVICKTKTHIYSPQDLVHRYQRYSPKVCCEGLSDLSGAFVDCWESVGR